MTIAAPGGAGGEDWVGARGSTRGSGSRLTGGADPGDHIRMAATFHLARYSPGNALRMLRAMRTGRRDLMRAPGIAGMQLLPTIDLEPVFGGRPTPTRWALFCGWRDRDARDEFFSDFAAPEPFLGPAHESWSVALDTVRVVNGEWLGWRPDTEGVEPLARDEPLAVITYGQIRPRYVPAFMWNNRKAVRQVVRQPGLIERVGLGSGVRLASTFSLWRSQGDVVRYAYGPGDHNPIQRRSLDAPWGTNYFFARFRPVASRGEWNGRDPLAEAAREPAVAA